VLFTEMVGRLVKTVSDDQTGTLNESLGGGVRGSNEQQRLGRRVGLTRA
jgi:hypothetical protein